MLDKQIKRIRRHKRVRSRISGAAKAPRLCVFRSSKHAYAQLIDDDKGKTILSSSDFELASSKLKAQSSLKDSKKKSKKSAEREAKTAMAFEVGRLLAKKALAKGIKKVIFDRGGYKYHGRIKALAEGAREGGLQF